MKDTFDELVIKSETLQNFIDRKTMKIGQLYSEYSRKNNPELMKNISTELELLKKAEIEKQIIDDKIKTADTQK